MYRTSITSPSLTALNSPSAPLLTEAEAAAYLSMSKRSLQAWRIRGGGPAFIHLGRCVRYHMSDIESFVRAGRRLSTSEEGGK